MGKELVKPYITRGCEECLGLQPPLLLTPCSLEAGVWPTDQLWEWGEGVGHSFDRWVGVAGFRKKQNSLERRGEKDSSFLCFQTQLDYLLLREAFLTT